MACVVVCVQLSVLAELTASFIHSFTKSPSTTSPACGAAHLEVAYGVDAAGDEGSGVVGASGAGHSH